MGVLNSSRKVMKDFIEKSYSMGQLHGEMKKINDPRRQNLIETVHLTKAEENKIDTLFTANYGKKIKYDWHRLYQSFTGKFDENYFPEYLFSSVLEPKLNPMDYRYVLDDKLLLPLFCVGVEHVRTPRTYYSVCDGICFDEEKNIVDRTTDIIYYAHKHILDISCKKSVLRVLRVALVISLNVILYKLLVGKYVMNSWGEWIMYAVIASIIALVTAGLIYFITERNQFLTCINMIIKRKVKR